MTPASFLPRLAAQWSGKAAEKQRLEPPTYMSRGLPEAVGPPGASEMNDSTNFGESFNPADQHNKILLSEKQ